MILVIVNLQYSLIAIAKILLLNGSFDSYAKMYFVRVALQFYILLDINHSIHAVHVASKAIIIFSLQIRIGYGIMYCHTLVY